MKVMALASIIETAIVMIKEHGATLIDGTIRACFGPNGELYCLPIYVINPPVKYGSTNDINIPEDTAVENLKAILHNNYQLKIAFREKMIELEVQDNMKGSQLKEEFGIKLGKPEGTIRLFCIGQEITDTFPLSKYNLSNDFVVISKIIE